MTTLAVMTSGGDAPGMNTAIRAVVKFAAVRGVKVLGVERGYEGLIEGQFVELTRAAGKRGIVPIRSVDDLTGRGGTLLGSSRSARFLTADGRRCAAANLNDIDGLIVIGGNGSLAGAGALNAEHALQVIGIPASIDNDIGGTSLSIGVDTALNTIVNACDRISDTARAHHRAFVVEVMGRDCGYLAMAGAIAAGADAVLFREQGRSDDEILDRVESVVRESFAPERAKERVLIIKSEGVRMPCTYMVRTLQSRLDKSMPGVEMRATVLGHLVRGGAPSFIDRQVAGRLSMCAVDEILKGLGGMVAWRPEVSGGEKTIDPFVERFSFDRVNAETSALLNNEGDAAMERMGMLESVEGVLGL